MSSYSSELAFAKKLALAAGEMMRKNFGYEKKAIWKEDNTPLTETDTAINEYVIQQVMASYPADGVLGEEDSFDLDADRLWVVDPVDGTQAFDLGSATFTFIIALVIEGQPVLGVIYEPMTDSMYSAEIGQGAFLNGQKIHVNAESQLAQNYFVSSSPAPNGFYDLGELMDVVEAERGKAFNYRSFAYGSTFVAAGSAVATIFGQNKPWDVAATKIIVEEAGGKVTDLDGSDRRYDSFDGLGLIASNGVIHDKIIELIKK